MQRFMLLIKQYRELLIEIDIIDCSSHYKVDLPIFIAAKSHIVHISKISSHPRH